MSDMKLSERFLAAGEPGISLSFSNLEEEIEALKAEVKKHEDLVPEDLGDYLELKEKNDQLEELFNLQFARHMEVQKKWTTAHPEQPLTHPDLGELLEWILGAISAVALERDALKDRVAFLEGNQCK